jgi:hypothetical protein
MTHQLEDDLRKLEAEADRVSPGAAAHVLNRAGDMCLGAGERERALAFYGRAIDASLTARRYNAAAGLCRKVLRVVPSAIRTRCTLAWLALGRGDVEETTREIGGYVSAATSAGQEDLVAAHLHMMAQTTRVTEIRRTLAEHLATLGRTDDAKTIRDSLPDHALRPVLSAEEQEQLWRDVVRSAMLGPQDLPV